MRGVVQKEFYAQIDYKVMIYHLKLSRHGNSLSKQYMCQVSNKYAWSFDNLNHPVIFYRKNDLLW